MVGTTEYRIPLNLIKCRRRNSKNRRRNNLFRRFLKSVLVKLTIKSLYGNAKPEIVDNERNKQADAQSQTENIKRKFEQIKNNSRFFCYLTLKRKGTVIFKR